MVRSLRVSLCLFAAGCATAGGQAEEAQPPSPWELGAHERLLKFDRDGSERIEAGEIDAVPCRLWQDLDRELLHAERVGLVVRYGLKPGMLFGGTAIGLAESSRQRISTRLDLCLGTQTPTAGATLAAQIFALRATPSSPQWDEAVAEILREFDSDRSGSIDRYLEVFDIPCEVFVALEEAIQATTNAPFAAIYGFGPGFEWVGGVLGFDPAVREETRRALDGCLIAE